jgi:phosphoglycerate kinase
MKEKTKYFTFAQNDKTMQSIETYNFTGKRALVRVDFNVPLNKQLQVTDDTRIRAAIPTIKKIISKGGSVVLMSHFGRPENGSEEKYSLKHILYKLEELLSEKVIFVSDCIGETARGVTSKLKAGQIALLENVRFYKEETKGDEFFAGQLAQHGDVYVNDAFGTAHRAHASTAIIANFFPNDKMFGYLMEGEIKSVDKVLFSKEKPVTAIIGGAKVSSKISILENLLDKVDNIIIGGGMAYTFIKAQGGKVGSSLVEDDKMEMALEIIEKCKQKNVIFHLPTDTIIADNFSNEASIDYCEIDAIPEGWMGLDIGKETCKQFESVILQSKIILWNGPMGVFEMSNFERGTKDIAEALVRATEKGCFTLVGGGDSVAAVNKYNLGEKVSYVSTGGGAMLEYLEGIDLPGIKAIRE